MREFYKVVIHRHEHRQQAHLAHRQIRFDQPLKHQNLSSQLIRDSESSNRLPTVTSHTNEIVQQLTVRIHTFSANPEESAKYPYKTYEQLHDTGKVTEDGTQGGSPTLSRDSAIATAEIWALTHDDCPDEWPSLQTPRPAPGLRNFPARRSPLKLCCDLCCCTTQVQTTREK